jgi:hypothetical protein
MKTDISINDNIIKVEFDNVLIPDVTYDANAVVDFTELVKSISELDEKLVLEPVDHETFNEKNTYDCERSDKIIEYLYKILNTFNISYDEVYE